MVGKIVRVEFLDNLVWGSPNDSDPYRCAVYGEIIEDTETHLKVRSWATERDFGQSEGYTIVKGHGFKVIELQS